MPAAPEQIRQLADQRAAARAAGDFATADRVRDQLAAAGWVVTDQPGGYRLTPAAPFPVLASVAGLPDRSGQPDARSATVAVVVDGWPQDVQRFLPALLRWLPPDTGVLALDVGDVDGAGRAVHQLAAADPRVEVFHVPAGVGWAAARTALLRADTARVHVWCESSTVFAGDALSQLLAPFADPTVAVTGWRGVNVDVTDEWRSFVDAGPGEVDAVLGYLLAVRRSAALAVGGPHPKARFYRNADMEFCFRVRAAGAGRVVVPAGRLPVQQTRHRGYHDSDPVYRDGESRRNYQRFLAGFRGRTDLLAPRPTDAGQPASANSLASRSRPSASWSSPNA